MNATISRRKFITVSSFTGAAFTLGFYFPAASKTLGKILTGDDADDKGIMLTAWISIDKKGLVTIFDHRSEMGQGSFQSVPQMVAEELEVSMEQIKIEFTQGAQGKYGSQITGGSSTVRGGYKTLLKTGATAREMLIIAAAAKWKVAPTECYAEKGLVYHKPSGKKYNYGDLAEEAAKLTPPENVALKDRKDYKLVGKPLRRRDTILKVNGEAQFGLDKKLPGMLYAVVERNPRFRGTVKSIDSKAAMAIPGVKKIFKVEMPVFGFTRHGVAIVADTLYGAFQAKKLLKVEWNDEGFEHINTEQLYDRMRSDLAKPHNSQRTGGNFETAFAAAEKKLDVVYETPYETHSCMEPLNCTAFYQEDKCEIWGPIQAPDWIQSDVSGRLGWPAEKVIVNMTFLGGGFGRKAFTDYTYEAVLVSKEMKAPVQVIWTREDDMTQGPFRPGAVYGCKVALNADGHIDALQVKMAAQNMDMQNPNADKKSFNGNTTEGFAEPYFESIRHYSFGDIPTETVIPVMWWRSVYSSTNGFAFESIIDEAANLAGKDAIEFRKEHLANERHQAVLEKIAQASDWKNKAKNSGWGLAITQCFGTIVGEAVKVGLNENGKVVIEKVIAVMDCGWYVNPDIIKAQVEGSIVMALAASSIHATHFEDGKAVEKNFHQYIMPRIADIPPIEIFVMDNDEKPGGAGEPGLPPFAPALCNAIFDLTGKRIRKLPFDISTL